ncbi:hypothetical protein CL617_01490 [archaeon]|nr:hypothetical protein [archaeon]|tara:strand:- start:3958 stop:4968 length:1011 start_codon:yes stop_codon:yes gene_type:complete
MSLIEGLFLSKKIKAKLINILVSAGIKKKVSSIVKRILISSFILSLLVFFFFFTDNVRRYYGARIGVAILTFWLLSLAISIGVILFFGYSYVSIKKYQRTKAIETILPDYLQLVAGNVSAGMPIDQALWFSVRERFGALGEEIELVAKKAMTGIDLKVALVEFSNKYDSDMLNKSIALLVEGLESGGEVAELVNRIAINIKENQILKQELAGDVLTYAIFIGFAAALAAPFLFALSHRIIIVMLDITSKIDVSSLSTVSSQISLKSGQGITPDDFKKFALIMLVVTSLISSSLISVIRKGTIKEGFKFIPFMVAISVIIFLIGSAILSTFFSGFTT